MKHPRLCNLCKYKPARLSPWERGGGVFWEFTSSRAFSDDLFVLLDGKCLACTYRAKFIEISVGINHNVDELLVGILTQIRMKRANADKESGHHWWVIII